MHLIQNKKKKKKNIITFLQGSSISFALNAVKQKNPKPKIMISTEIVPRSLSLIPFSNQSHRHSLFNKNIKRAHE